MPGYAHLSCAEVTETAEKSLGLLIGRLAGRTSAAELRGLSAELGRRRPAQGIELDEMLTAIRLDFRVLWAGLIRSVDDADAPRLLTLTEDVLATVEEYSSYAQRAYLKAEEELAADQALQVRRLLTHFLTCDDPVALAGQVAGLSGFDVEATFTVWTIRARAESPLLREICQSLGSQSLLHHWVAVGDSIVVIIESARPPARPQLSDESVLVTAPVDGLAEVPAAVERALRLVAFAAAGQWSTEREVWVPFLHEHLAHTLPHRLAELTEGLGSLPDDERQRVIDTVLAYLACGSTQETARRCYVHRNTVLNRLRLFRDCTDLDVTVPVDAAEALLALGRPVPVADRLAGPAEPHLRGTSSPAV